MSEISPSIKEEWLAQALQDFMGGEVDFEDCLDEVRFVLAQLGRWDREVVGTPPTNPWPMTRSCGPIGTDPHGGRIFDGRMLTSPWNGVPDDPDDDPCVGAVI